LDESQRARLVRARRREDGRPVLLKILTAAHPRPQDAASLEHEMRIASELPSTAVLRPLGLDWHEGHRVLVLEDFPGQPLTRLLGSPMPVGRFLRLALPIAAALEQLHRAAVIHKDIQPASVLVANDGSGVKLLHFELASQHVREQEKPRSPQEIEGALAYVSPEQTGRTGELVDRRTDLYSLGVVFHEMLTGALPFAATDPLELVHAKLARVAPRVSETVPDAPEMLSQITARLLGKSAADRYQSAAGLRADLEVCARSWETEGHVVPFALGRRDVPERIEPTARLHGREPEIDLLLGAARRVAETGATEVVAISGPAGIGKSALLRELRNRAHGEEWLFVSGGFIALGSDLPYAGIVGAFQSCVAEILAGEENDIGAWRERFRKALGSQGGLLTQLLPGLERLVGEQPMVPELPFEQAALRFARLFSQFLGVFRTPCLVLCLEDLQWADRASLELLERVVAGPSPARLLVVVTYRDAEVVAAHPARSTLDALRSGGARFQPIELGPLALEAVNGLVADVLGSTREAAEPLAALLDRQSGGNPFFLVQLLTTLYEETLLELDAATGAWRWDVAKIAAKGFTTNVVDFMVARVGHLPARAREALTLAACLGRTADSAVLAAVCGCSEDDLATDLRDAVGEGLVLRTGDAYSFTHDRVQEAAYALIPEGARALAHLRVGRTLRSRAADGGAGGPQVLAIVDQMNRGSTLVADPEERVGLARLNFAAGRRAVAVHAYSNAARYLATSAALLGGHAWREHYDLAVPLTMARAQCEFLLGHIQPALLLCRQAVTNARSVLEEAAALALELHILVADGAIAESVDLEWRCLAKLGIHLPARPTDGEVLAARDTVQRLLSGRPIEEAIDGLPAMVDPEKQAALRIIAPSSMTDANAYSLHVATMVALGLQHGNADASSEWYGQYGMVLAALGDYRGAEAFARAGHALARSRGLAEGRAYFYDEKALFWTRSLDEAVLAVRKAMSLTTESGDTVVASYCSIDLLTELLDRGDRLDEVHAEAETLLEAARRGGLRDVADILLLLRQFVRSVQGRTDALGSFGDEALDEIALRAKMTEGRIVLLGTWLWIYKLRSTFLAGDFDEALACGERLEPLIWAQFSYPPCRTYHVYRALALAAGVPATTEAERSALRDRIGVHERQIRAWAELNPRGFAHHHALVLAEIARLEGRTAEAETLYEVSMRLAGEGRFVHDEAVACEVAARFQQARGFPVIAHAYARRARACYARWGATGKVADVDRRYPEDVVEAAGAPLAPTGLDAVAVVKASQAISGEIVLERLLEKLLRIILEEGGAERGALLLSRAQGLVVAATATVDGASIAVRVCEPPEAITDDGLPESVLRYVQRTHEAVILANASGHRIFGLDPDVVRRGAKAIVCLPILRQSQLRGVLYLENASVAGSFTPQRLSVLEVLVAQIAISLENAESFARVERTEASIRASQLLLQGILDTSTAVIYVKDLEGRYLLVNRRYEELFHVTKASIVGKTDYDVFPKEQADAFRSNDRAVLESGQAVQSEESAPHDDGLHSYVSVKSALKDDAGRTYAVCGISTDITRMKRMEEHLRQSQKLEALGSLTGGIAHDFNNLLTVINGCGNLALRSSGTPELVRRHLEEIVQSGERAARLTRQLLAYGRQQILEMRPWSLSAIVRDMEPMLKLLAGDDVRLELALSSEPDTVEVDRGQIEQVVMNLVVNARDAMPDGGVVTVSTGIESLDPIHPTAPEPHVMLSVRDTGIGMTPGVKARIFEPFFTTKETGKGTGLGLSVVYGIIQQSGGALSVDSAVGKGTTFRIHLPLARVDASTSAAPGAREEEVAYHGDEAILLVEDDDSVRRFAAEALRNAGYTVLEARGATEALELLGRPDSRVEILVTDVLMPKVDGFHLADRVHDGDPSLPVVFMSAYARREEPGGRLAGLEHFLQKPFTPSQLLKTVRDTLDGAGNRRA
jgi:PAS domain S-box-containing protein